MKNTAILKGLLFSTLSLACSVALAGSVTVSDNTASPTETDPVAVTVSYAADAGDTTVGYECTITTPAGLTYDSATALHGDALCFVNAGNAVVSVATPMVDPVADGNHCEFKYTIDAGASDGDVFVLAPSCDFFDSALNSLGGGENSGEITIVEQGPPAITIDNTPVALPGGVFGTSTSADITVTVSDNGDPDLANDWASYSCTASAGFSISPADGGPITNGDDLDDITVSTTLTNAAQNGNVECTVTYSDGTSVDFTIPVSAPAGVESAPVLTSSPADGDTVNVSGGTPGSNGTAGISVSAVGGVGTEEANITCTSADPAVTVNNGGPHSFAPGAAGVNIGISVELDTVDQDFTPGVTCTGQMADSSGNLVDFTWEFDVHAPAGTSAPNFIPATSLWSKIALFGFFGLLGVLAVRRRG